MTNYDKWWKEKAQGTWGHAEPAAGGASGKAFDEGSALIYSGYLTWSKTLRQPLISGCGVSCCVCRSESWALAAKPSHGHWISNRDRELLGGCSGKGISWNTPAPLEEATLCPIPIPSRGEAFSSQDLLPCWPALGPRSWWVWVLLGTVRSRHRSRWDLLLFFV